MLKSLALVGTLLLRPWAPGVGPAAESNLLANGGFETVGRLSRQRRERLAGEGVRFEKEDPLLPVRWTWTASGRPAELRLVPQAHSGRRALRVVTPKDGTLRLSMGVIEVVPNATYAFGAWTRGSGRGAVVVQGHAFEGPKELARHDVEPTASWTEVRGLVTIPGHVRTVTVELAAWGEGEITWDDTFFSADLAMPYDPDAVLLAKPLADADTLAFVDFDRPGTYRLEAGARITPEGGGRTILGGYHNQVVTSADGMVEPAVAMDAALRYSDVLGPTATAAGEVPKAAFCNWRRKRASAGRSSNHFRVRLQVK